MSRKGSVSEIVLKHYDELKILLQKYNVFQVRIFGLVARNEDTEISDVDFLINLSKNKTLFEYGQLRYELEDLLQVPIDMLTYTGLNPITLVQFCKNSIMLEELPSLTNETAIEEKMTDFVLVLQNLKSAVWVIDRILESCKNISKEEFMSHELVQDAVTRNIQLLGKVVSQIPKQALENLNGLDVAVLKGCITLKEALFMNVDYVLLWNTIVMELTPMKCSLQKIIKERESVA